MEKPTTITITTSDLYEAKKMLDWYQYAGACNAIRQRIRSRLKYAEDVSEAESRFLEELRDELPPEDD